MTGSRKLGQGEGGGSWGGGAQQPLHLSPLQSTGPGVAQHGFRCSKLGSPQETKPPRLPMVPDCVTSRWGAPRHSHPLRGRVLCMPGLDLSSCSSPLPSPPRPSGLHRPLMPTVMLQPGKKKCWCLWRQAMSEVRWVSTVPHLGNGVAAGSPGPSLQLLLHPPAPAFWPLTTAQLQGNPVGLLFTDQASVLSDRKAATHLAKVGAIPGPRTRR